MIWKEKENLSSVFDFEFPNEADRLRVEEYNVHRFLRHDKHDDIFPRIQALFDTVQQQRNSEKFGALTYIPLNALGLLSQANAEDLFLEPPEVSVKDNDQQSTAGMVQGQEQTKESTQAKTPEDALEDIINRNKFWKMCFDAVDGASVNGVMVFKVYKEDDIGVMIDEVDPSLVFRAEDYFPEYAAKNRDPRKCMFPMIATPIKKNNSWYVLFEIHEPGEVIYRAYYWRVKDSDLKAPSFVSEGVLTYEVDVDKLNLEVDDYKTGLKDPAVIIIENAKGARAYWGASDYSQGLKALQDQLNYHFSSLSDHSERLMAGGVWVFPTGVIGQAMMLGVDMGLKTGRQSQNGTDYGRKGLGDGALPTLSRNKLDWLVEDATTKDVTRHITEQPHYDGAFKLLEGYWNLFGQLSELTLPPIWDHERLPESGRAMRITRERDQRRIRRKRLRFTPDFQHLLQLALQLEGHDVPPPSWAWQSPIPLGDDEKAEIIDKRTGGKASMSRKTAMQRYDGYTDAEADEELARIKEEEHASGNIVSHANEWATQPAEANDFPEQNTEEDEL